MKKRVELIIIDPQHDFCDTNGALFVPGADEDIIRLATMIERCKNQIDDIHVTLDMHHFFDVAHPIFWEDSSGKHPNPLTIITLDDVKQGKWTPVISRLKDRMTNYLEELENKGRYPLCIWPPHCLIGSVGSTVSPALYKALLDWEQSYAMVDYVTKGSNYLTEHYSAVQAEVPDPEDPGTHLNINLIKTLEKADIIGTGGEALTHCWLNTLRDIIDNLGEEQIKKFVFLEGTSSPVPGFEKQGEDFINEMVGRGMTIQKSTDFLR